MKKKTTDGQNLNTRGNRLATGTGEAAQNSGKTADFRPRAASQLRRVQPKVTRKRVGCKRAYFQLTPPDRDRNGYFVGRGQHGGSSSGPTGVRRCVAPGPHRGVGSAPRARYFPPLGSSGVM
jgi:hypothetical protein